MNDKSTDEKISRWCVLLPCSAHERWAVPQNCLAEIVTLPTAGEEPPESFTWRGQDVSILNLDESRETPWRDARTGTGLVAVMLGLKGGSWEYCAVALRGDGLGMKDLAGESLEDASDLALDGSVSAFSMGGEIYQVPRLQELHTRKNTQLSAA